MRTQNFLILRHLSVILMLWVSTTHADMALSKARVATPTVVSIPQVDTYLKEVSRKRKLNEDEAKFLKLANLGRDLFDNQILSSACSRYDSAFKPDSSQLSTPEKGLNSISIESVGCPIRFGIQKNPKWDLKLSAKQLTLLKSEQAFMVETFASDPYVLAWLSYQLGDKAKAKKMLVDRFQARHDTVMKIESTVSFGGEDKPLVEDEFTLQALDLMSTDSEKKTNAEKMREMKTHMSTIPNHRVMT